MTHAEVQAARWSEHAVVEGLLVLFGVGRCVPNRLPILLFGVATPHLVNWLLAGKEVVSALLDHIGVAHFHANLVIFALSVPIAQKTDLVSIGNDTFIFETNGMRSALFLLVVKGFVDGFVVEGLWVG